MQRGGSHQHTTSSSLTPVASSSQNSSKKPPPVEPLNDNAVIIPGVELKIPCCIGSLAYSLGKKDSSLKKTHRWICYVRNAYPEQVPPLESILKCVCFHVDRSFGIENNVVVCEKPPYSVELEGWAECYVSVHLHFKDGTDMAPLELRHLVLLHERKGISTLSEFRKSFLEEQEVQRMAGEAGNLLSPTAPASPSSPTASSSKVNVKQPLPTVISAGLVASSGDPPVYPVQDQLDEDIPVVSERKSTILIVHPSLAFYSMFCEETNARMESRSRKRSRSSGEEEEGSSGPMGHPSWPPLPESTWKYVEAHAKERKELCIERLQHVKKKLRCEFKDTVAGLLNSCRETRTYCEGIKKELELMVAEERALSR